MGKRSVSLPSFSREGKQEAAAAAEPWQPADVAGPGSWMPRQAWFDMALSLGFALGLACFCHMLVAEARFIPSPSMVPTLAIGDRLIIEKVSYELGTPGRGDIVVFHPPDVVAALGYADTTIPWIKRVIGLPGETVSVVRGQVRVDGVAIADPYPSEPADYDMPARRVPAGQLFVLGDNRNHSVDSHIWGTFGVERVIGRACYRFWPLERFGLLTPAPKGHALAALAD